MVKCSMFGEILVPRDHPAFPVGISPYGSFQLCCHEKVVQKWCSQISLKKHEQGGVRGAEASVGWHEAGH